VVVGKPNPGGPTERLAGELALGDKVRFAHGISDAELAELAASAQVAVVPSRYEGFSLPAVEHMASGTPLIVSRTRALPEVAGGTGGAGAARRPGGTGRGTAGPARLAGPARPARPGRLAPGPGAVRLARRRPGHRRGIPPGDRCPPGRAPPGRRHWREGSRPLLTVDFRRFPVRPGNRLLDLGCGAGRHAFEACRRGAEVVAFDADHGELRQVSGMTAAMAAAGEVPPAARARPGRGDATAIPVGGGSLARVIAAEVLEHIPLDARAIAEIARVLRPGGLLAVTVPAWLPERICWRLSDDYHNTPGGHVRIYTRPELAVKLRAAGFEGGGPPHAPAPPPPHSRP